MRARTVLPALCLFAVVSACATMGSEGGGIDNLPTSGVGPFRKLASAEVLGIAPFVFDDRVRHYREPSVVLADPTASGGAVLLYAVATVTDGGVQHDVIVRTRADDARSFYGSALDFGHIAPTVLRGDSAWEGANLSGPSVLRASGRFYLYYACDGGIALARSDDGLSFTKESAPVFAPDRRVLWETSVPRAPSVALFPDGTFHMMYASGDSIGEATSPDGLAWTRVDGDSTTPWHDPVLSPSAPVDPATLAPGEKPPFDTLRVGDPMLAPRMTPAGRLHVRVLYTGISASDGGAETSAIGFAGRFDEGAGDTALTRQALPVYSVGQREAAPALLEFGLGSMLYVSQTREVDSTTSYTTVAAAFAPADHVLSAPSAFSATP